MPKNEHQTSFRYSEELHEALEEATDQGPYNVPTAEVIRTILREQLLDEENHS